MLRIYIENTWLLIFAVANAASFIMFGLDKAAARLAWRRIPEYLLYLVSFLGGPIGAVAAMKFFRHKTQKTNFQLVLAFLILVQVVMAIYFLY